MIKKVKKIFVCFTVVSLLCLTACSQRAFPEDISSKHILNAAQSVTEQPKSIALYIKGENEFDSYTMSLWSDSAYKECPEFDLISDYAVYYSSDNTTYEIAVLKAKDKQSTKALVSLLERRKLTLSNGGKAAYDPNFTALIDDARIVTEQEFVILLITSDNDAAISEIEKLKQ